MIEAEIGHDDLSPFMLHRRGVWRSGPRLGAWRAACGGRNLDLQWGIRAAWSAQIREVFPLPAVFGCRRMSRSRPTDPIN